MLSHLNRYDIYLLYLASLKMSIMETCIRMKQFNECYKMIRQLIQVLNKKLEEEIQPGQIPTQVGVIASREGWGKGFDIHLFEVPQSIILSSAR